ncbi:hypothetical protein [Spiroplasma cantharicola]|uniref:Uncharacterized protein n=1 Tax=Spiroplasma cantharicola TaxID=362837 RepID=A0A0M5KJ16_9MOLU|nr:hypothetical protein [Spiroplasma cantharicola]ALD66069.1 hypothetical protein SCANT_v1c01590 [Spiroplasma cantharicola]
MKKLLLAFSSISLTAIPSLNIISCTPEIEDEDYFIPTEQPKNIEEIETNFKLAVDKNEDFLVQAYKEWAEHKIKIDWDNLKKDEQDIERIKFNHNSIETQKSKIYIFWMWVYQYKIYQFDKNYKKELVTNNGIKRTLKAENEETFKFFLELALKNEFHNDKTKEHIKKMYDWGIQENPNAKV